MRELKFRAWDTNAECWLPSGEIDGYVQVKALVPEGSGFFEFYIGPFGNEVVLQQFTGLKDRNGRDIYEGDILDDPSMYPMAVAYHEQTAAFGRLDTNEDLYVLDYKGCKIIGNIYENPELLESK